MSITLSALQKQRRDTAANWTTQNPTLLAGEIGIESDTGYWKVGDGTTAWASLGYVLATKLTAYPLVNADIASNAEIAVSKLADGTARQLLQTDAAGTGVEWASNIDVPGTLDVTGAATFDAAVTIQGDLTVNGTTTTIDTQHLIVEDKNVVIGQVTSPTDVTADGGGITLKGTTDKTINWVDATDAWTFSEHVNLASGKAYYINGTQVLSGSALGSGVTSSSLTSVGTIGTGVWQGTTVATGYGGTGIAGSYTDGQLLIGKTDGTLAKATLTAGSNVSITNGDGSISIASTDTTYTAGDGLDLVGTTFSADLKANGGLVIESTELAVDLGASSITGTLGVADGGTGQTTYTDGQLLIGNSTGNTLAKSTLTAGSGVTITNGNGSITISATGSGGTITSVTATNPLASSGGNTPDISIQAATTSQSGAVQLTDSTSSTSTTTAATPNSVKTAYDLANAALPKAGGTLTGDLTLNAQSDLRFADADSSNWVALQAASTINSNITWTLPATDGTNGQVLSTNGTGTLSWATAGGSFASGTAMLFVQTSAPTGWTKSTTHNDKVLRVVSGSASSGGSTAFTTVFASRTPAGTVGSTTLTESQIPSHTHTYTRADGNFTGTGYNTGTTRYAQSVNTGATGGGGSHDHSFTGTAMDFAVQYVDVIIATKD
jgi:hypothetical protein